MQLNKTLAAAGIFMPDDVDLLRAVYDKMALDTDTAIDRESRAASLVLLYQQGMRTEAELLHALGYPAT